MGAAESSAQRDAPSQEDASASASAAGELSAIQEGGGVLESKALEKNGQISSMSSLNGHSEDNTLAEGNKTEPPPRTPTPKPRPRPFKTPPHAFLNTVGQPDGGSVSQKEEAAETMDAIQDEVAPQVNENKDEKATADASDISAVEENAAEEKPQDVSEVGFKKIFRFVGFKFTLKKDKAEEKDPVELLTVKDKEEESKTEEPTKEADEANVEESLSEAKEVKAEEPNAEVTVDGKEAESTETAVREDDSQKEPDATIPSPEAALSPFRKLFSTGLFSTLKKKTSIKKTKEEEEKEVSPEGEAKKKEDASADEKADGLKSETEQECQEPEAQTSVEEKAEPKGEAKTGPSEEPQATQEDKIQPSAEEESGTAEVISEPELLSSQEKAKVQGSPLKKLFTGAGLKKLSTKKQKTRKDTETKAESGEDAVEQLQSSTESAEAPKTDSGPSSPEESGEHADVQQLESTQESHGEVADGEKKKEGIIAWSSFKKLVTPKRRVKRSSESDEEAPEEKPAKTTTLSSSQSSAEEETKEDQPNEETENAEKLESTEEPKKKMDTSVSWDALMCMGGPKKRTRKTSDSDEEEPKIEEDMQPAAEGEQMAEAAIVTSQSSEPDGKFRSSGEHSNKESAWDTLKRVVMPKPKAKVEEKPGESSEQIQSDGEAQKDEPSFSFKKFLPGRRKKKADKHASDQGSSEEDSDTPAVVPLSEYTEQVETKEEAVVEAESDVSQVNVPGDDRAPSWIPAAVDDTDPRKELSDIVEEADTAATSKSADTDVAEDEIEDEPIEPPKPSQDMECRLSRAEEKSVAPAPAGETTPVPQGPKPDKADVVREGIDVLVSEIPTQMSVAVNDVPIVVACEKIEYEPPTDKAECKTNTLLEPHAREEATAICTGLVTREIAEVTLEKPAMPIIESVAVIGNGLSMEVAVQDKPHQAADASVTEDPLLRAQVHQVETTSLEPAVEISTNDVSVIQTASEHYEPDVEPSGVVTTVVEAEMLLPPTSSENSPKTILVNSITPTTEEPVCSRIIEVTEHTVEMKVMEVEMQHQNATQEYTPLNAVAEAVCKTTNISVTKESEVAIPVNVPVEEAPMITNTKVLVGPPSDIEVNQAELSDVELVQNEAIQVQEASKCGSAEENKEPDVIIDQCQEHVEQLDVPVEEAPMITNTKVLVGPPPDIGVDQAELSDVELVQNEAIQVQEASKCDSAAETEEPDVINDQCQEHVEQLDAEVQQAGDIEAQSVVITQAVIQDAVDKVSKDVEEPKEPSSPTPVQAETSTEKEVEVSTETAIVTDVPKVLSCEKSPKPLNVALEIIDSVPLEAANSLNLSEEEEKPQKDEKQAVEVQVSDETAIVEVKEIERESDEGQKQIEEKESKEESAQEPEIERVVEVENVNEAEKSKSEALLEEKNPEVIEIQMPVQVVLQTAQVMEHPSVEEEAAKELDSNGSEVKDTSVDLQSTAAPNNPTNLVEEPQGIPSEDSDPSQVTQAAASQPEEEKGSSVTCAQVMAQVIEVIEEAVKEIEPAMEDNSAAS